MAKIGIYTFSSSVDNYGEVLQYLATQEYLKQRGHAPYLLRIKMKMPVSYRIKRLVFSVINYIKKKGKNDVFSEWHRWSDYYEKFHPRHFEEFRLQNFNIVSANDKTIESYNFDAYAAGSDQVWAGVAPIPFLQFPPEDVIRFSIASSTGNIAFDAKQIRRCSEYLKKFSFVTTREMSGVKLCSQSGYSNAYCVLDPTFLIDTSAYNNYAKHVKDEKGYIFLYLLGADVDIKVEQIFEFAKNSKLEVKYVASQGRHDSFEKEWASVPEWIGLLANAKYVITNSFHGTAISIIFHKQFLTLPITGELSRMNERIYSILNRFNIKSRILNDCNIYRIFEEIDFSVADSEIKKNIEEMNIYMESAKL